MCGLAADTDLREAGGKPGEAYASKLLNALLRQTTDALSIKLLNALLGQTAEASDRAPQANDEGPADKRRVASDRSEGRRWPASAVDGGQCWPQHMGAVLDLVAVDKISRKKKVPPGIPTGNNAPSMPNRRGIITYT